MGFLYWWTTQDGKVREGKPIDKGLLYKLLNNRTYLGDRPWDTAPSPLQQALARGHRWLAMLTSREARSLKDVAARQGVDSSYLGRMLRPPWRGTSSPPFWTTRCRVM